MPTEREVLSYLSSHVGDLYPGYHVRQEQAPLPSLGHVDIHAKDEEGHDLFLEFRPELRKHDLGWIVDFYSAVTNLVPSKPALAFVGFRADPEVRKVLKQLDVDFIPLSRLPIEKVQLRKWWEQVQGRRARLLPPEESRTVSYLQSHRAQAVTVRDLASVFGISQNHASQLVRRLERKGWLSKIERGKFLYIPAEYGYDERFPPMHPFLPGSVLISPYYYSFATANAHYGLTTQIRSTVFLATTRRKPPVVWRGNRFRFVNMRPARFFGYVRVIVDQAEVRMASLEKAVIDSILRSDLAGGLPEVVAVLANAMPRADEGRLLDYAIRMRSRSVVQRLGFLLDFLEKSGERTVSDASRTRLLKAVGNSPVHLASVRRYGAGGVFNKTWRLYVNLSPAELLSELRVR